MELVAFRSYREQEFDLAFRRTKSGLEVDLVLDDGRIAVESRTRVRPGELKSIKAFANEFSPERAMIVCDEATVRVVEGIEMLPWRQFLHELWDSRLGFG